MKSESSTNEKCSEATQTLHSGCSKVDQQTNTHQQTGVITIHCTLVHSLAHSEITYK